jgi:hypothetical protein
MQTIETTEEYMKINIMLRDLEKKVRISNSSKVIDVVPDFVTLSQVRPAHAMPVDPTTTVLPQTSQGPKNDEKPGSGNSISPSTPPTSDEEQISPVERPHPERTKRGTRWFLVCLGIFSANFLYGLDTTIAADIQAAVSETFENVTQLGWLGFGFCLGSTVAILPLGKMYAVFDTKWMFIGSLVMFAAGSALCGGPANINGLIVGRVWAGAGGAGMYLGYVEEE